MGVRKPILHQYDIYTVVVVVVVVVVVGDVCFSDQHHHPSDQVYCTVLLPFLIPRIFFFFHQPAARPSLSPALALSFNQSLSSSIPLHLTLLTIPHLVSSNPQSSTVHSLSSIFRPSPIPHHHIFVSYPSHSCTTSQPIHFPPLSSLSISSLTFPHTSAHPSFNNQFFSTVIFSVQFLGACVMM